MAFCRLAVGDSRVLRHACPQARDAAASPSLAAILTRSAREFAFIFRITLPRCAFTVISLIHRHRHVAVTRDENDRHINPVSRNALLQFKPVEIRERNVKHQAAWGQSARVREEILRGRENLGPSVYAQSTRRPAGFSKIDSSIHRRRTIVSPSSSHVESFLPMRLAP